MIFHCVPQLLREFLEFFLDTDGRLAQTLVAPDRVALQDFFDLLAVEPPVLTRRSRYVAVRLSGACVRLGKRDLASRFHVEARPPFDV